ncbi:MAG: protein kinase [Myxococcota bacterium]|nr:protein kinase [Myxococcota bacterium]
MADSSRQFRFIRPIARGGFGTVYLCKEEHNDGFSRVVAIKLLNAQWTDVDEVSSRIRDEARLLGLLRHRNIVDVYALTSIDGRSAVVMEYLDAVDLRYLMGHCRSVEARIPARVALEMVAAVANALDAAYNRPPKKGEKPLRVIHRDIKPSNIMIDGAGVPKVLDFGVAQSDIASREASTQELQFGSVEYMAPERLFFEPETPSSDVYSLAATLFELLTFERLGKAQGRASTHDAHLANRLSFLRGCIDVPPEVAAGVEALLLRALHFEHTHRPDAATFCQDAKQLARRIPTDDMVAWCEATVPAAVEAAMARSVEVEPLSDAILREDSAVLQPLDPTAETLRSPAIQRAVPSRESDRAAALRRGALAELDSASDIPISAGPSPLDPPGRPANGEWTDALGWNDQTQAEFTEGTQEAPSVAPTDVPEPVHQDTTRPSVPASPVAAPEVVRTPPRLPQSAATVEDERSQTAELPTFDTMAGLDPVPIKTPWSMVVLGAAVPLVLAMLVGVMAVAQDWGGVRGWFPGGGERSASRTLTGPSEAERAMAEGTATAAALDAVDAVAPEDGQIRFRSAWSETTKFRVRCSEGAAKGSTDAAIARAAASRCRVTAYGAGLGERMDTTVAVATPGLWVCFADGSDQCALQ